MMKLGRMAERRSRGPAASTGTSDRGLGNTSPAGGMRLLWSRPEDYPEDHPGNYND